jgi:hypothetical protein
VRVEITVVSVIITFVRVKIAMHVEITHSACYNHTRECRNHTPAFQNHNARGNYTLRV